MRYDGALAQVTRVFRGNKTECSREERRMFHAKRGYCEATIISCLPEVKSHRLSAEEVREERGDPGCCGEAGAGECDDDGGN